MQTGNQKSISPQFSLRSLLALMIGLSVGFGMALLLTTALDDSPTEIAEYPPAPPITILSSIQSIDRIEIKVVSDAIGYDSDWKRVAPNHHKLVTSAIIPLESYDAERVGYPTLETLVLINIYCQQETPIQVTAYHSPSRVILDLPDGWYFGGHSETFEAAMRLITQREDEP